MTRGCDHRLSPSVSIVMMKAVSDMAPRARGRNFRRADAIAGHLLEGGEIGREDPVLGELALHEGAASRARRRERAPVAEQSQHPCAHPQAPLGSRAPPTAA